MSPELRSFMLQKRGAGVPWHHIAAMAGKPVSVFAPYIALEEAYQAAAARRESLIASEVERITPAPAESAPAPKRRSRRKHEHPTPEMRLIAVKLAHKHGVNIDCVIGRSLDRSVINARQHIMWKLCSKGYSTTLIAEFLGGRDHTTVVAGVKAHMRRAGVSR